MQRSNFQIRTATLLTNRSSASFFGRIQLRSFDRQFSNWCNSSAALLRSGVRAILPRESDPDDVLSAIYAAYDGLVLLSTPAAESLAAVYGDQPLEAETELSEEITSRETEVLPPAPKR